MGGNGTDKIDNRKKISYKCLLRFERQNNPMPLPPISPETVEFDVLVDQMSKRLSFGDKEKLGVFIRGMIQKALEFASTKNHEKVPFEQAVFSLVGVARRLDVSTELKVLARGNGASEPKNICSISLKESDYKGVPDGSPKTSNGNGLVRRKRISVVDVKSANSKLWISAGFVIGKGKKKSDLVAHLDVQVDS